jgi:hypothetical protein
MAFVKKNHRNHIATGFLATLMNERGNLSVTPPTEPPIGTPPRRGLPRWISNLWTRLVISTQNVYQGIVLQRSIDRFYLVFRGHIFFETLYAAVENDLFSRLEDEPGLSTQEIATRLGIEAQPARILLLGLTSVKFLKKSGDRLFQHVLTKKLLTKKSPLNVLDYVRLQHHGMYKAMPHFVDALKTYSNVGFKEFPGDGSHVLSTPFVPAAAGKDFSRRHATTLRTNQCAVRQQRGPFRRETSGRRGGRGRHESHDLGPRPSPLEGNGV